MTKGNRDLHPTGKMSDFQKAELSNTTSPNAPIVGKDQRWVEKGHKKSYPTLSIPPKGKSGDLMIDIKSLNLSAPTAQISDLSQRKHIMGSVTSLSLFTFLLYSRSACLISAKTIKEASDVFLVATVFVSWTPYFLLRRPGVAVEAHVYRSRNALGIKGEFFYENPTPGILVISEFVG